jgi:C_GCAxxG_C_C family probable redox protein
MADIGNVSPLLFIFVSFNYPTWDEMMFSTTSDHKCGRLVMNFNPLRGPEVMSDTLTSVDRFLNGNGCSQAILTQFCEQFGMDQLTALKISSAFPAGMQMAGVCGAVTGAYMVLGLKFADQESSESAGRARVYEAVAEFTRRFRERHNTLDCKELLGCNIMTAEGKAAADQENLFRTVCPRFVEDAVTILQEMMVSPVENQ